jgi:hypothetical protein
MAGSDIASPVTAVGSPFHLRPMLRILKDKVSRGLGSTLTAVQSLCHQREQLRRRGEPVEDQYVSAIREANYGSYMVDNADQLISAD